MGGDAKGGRRVEFAEASDLALGMCEEMLLSGLVERVDVAGSVRRLKKHVGDLDLVVQPYEGKRNDLVNSLKTYLRGLSGEKILKGLTESGIQVDVYLATAEDFGAQLLTWTGSKEFNVMMRGMAKRQGMMLSQYGLFKGGVCVASKFEPDIFSQLGMDPVSPDVR